MHMNDILKALEPVRQFLLTSNVDAQTSNSVKTQFKTAQDIIASKDYDNDLVVLSQVCLTALRYLNNPPKELIDITLECLNKLPPKEGEMLDQLTSFLDTILPNKKLLSKIQPMLMTQDLFNDILAKGSE